MCQCFCFVLPPQGNLVYASDLDLTTYHNVAAYWSGRCLPPRGRGTLSILGLVPVADVTYYLQYYSLPVITALLTPVVRLVLALRHVYSHPTKPT